jgi:hypothetical protein
MITNSDIVAPFCVSVLEDYFNERPENVIVDLSKLDADNPYRRAVIDALNNPHQSVQVCYETMQDFGGEGVVATKKGVTIQGSVTLRELGNSAHDGYLPENYFEEEDEE